MEPKIDWYTASISTRPQVVIDCLTSEFEFSEAIPTTPKQGYERAIKIARGDTSLATVMWGGNTGINVYASASGGDSPAFAEVIRRAQARLNGYGFEAGEPDGRVGPVTLKALREFQSLNGLGESGRFDVATLKRLGVEP